MKDKRPSYEEWSAELKRVKREQERKAIEAAIEDEELSSKCDFQFGKLGGKRMIEMRDIILNNLLYESSLIMLLLSHALLRELEVTIGPSCR